MTTYIWVTWHEDMIAKEKWEVYVEAEALPLTLVRETEPGETETVIYNRVNKCGSSTLLSKFSSLPPSLLIIPPPSPAQCSQLPDWSPPGSAGRTNSQVLPPGPESRWVTKYFSEMKYFPLKYFQPWLDWPVSGTGRPSSVGTSSIQTSRSLAAGPDTSQWSASTLLYHLPCPDFWTPPLLLQLILDAIEFSNGLLLPSN